MRLWPTALVLAGAVLLTPSAAHAQPSKLFPADTDLVFTINLRQILDSPLVKKYGLDKAKEGFDSLLQASDDAKKIFDGLGLNPFTDIDRLVSTGSVSTDKDKGVGIIEGRFNPTKWKAVAADAAKNNGDVLKLGKLGNLDLWEVSIPGQDQNLFVVMPDAKTILFASKKGLLEDTLAQHAGTKAVNLKPLVKAMVARTSDKQSLSVLALSAGLIKALKESPQIQMLPNAEVIEKAIPQLEKLAPEVPGVSLSITITDEVKFSVGLNAKDAKTAKQISGLASVGVLGLGALAAQAAQNDEKLAPLVELVQNLKIAVEGNTVMIRGAITAAMIEKAAKAAGAQ